MRAGCSRLDPQHAMDPAFDPAFDPDHPAPMPRTLLARVPSEHLVQWKALHQVHHELHFYELGQAQERIKQLRGKLSAARQRKRYCDDGARSFLDGGLPGAQDRAKEFTLASQAHESECDRLRTLLDREDAHLHRVREMAGGLARRKDAILPLSGELDIDWAAARKRTPQEQTQLEVQMLRMYRDHYRSLREGQSRAKREPAEKAPEKDLDEAASEAPSDQAVLQTPGQHERPRA